MDNVQLLSDLSKNVNIIKGSAFNMNDELPTVESKHQIVDKEDFSQPNLSLESNKSDNFSTKNIIKIVCISFLLFIIFSNNNLNSFLTEYTNSFVSILIRSLLFILSIVILMYLL